MSNLSPKYRREQLASSIVAAAKDVTTAGTAEALASTQLCLAVTVRAKSANTGNVYVGGSAVDSTDGFPLAAGEAITLFVQDLADVYLDVDTNGEGVVYLAELA